VALKSLPPLSSARPITLDATPPTGALAASSNANLAVVLRLLGAHDQARWLNENAAEHLRSALGEQHLVTLACTMNMASDLHALGGHRTAYELDSSLAERVARTLGDHHRQRWAC
jgi:hypothetical protein